MARDGRYEATRLCDRQSHTGSWSRSASLPSARRRELRRASVAAATEEAPRMAGAGRAASTSPAGAAAARMLAWKEPQAKVRPSAGRGLKVRSSQAVLLAVDAGRTSAAAWRAWPEATQPRASRRPSTLEPVCALAVVLPVACCLGRRHLVGGPPQRARPSRRRRRGQSRSLVPTTRPKAGRRGGT
jgi:hypothetical protein